MIDLLDIPIFIPTKGRLNNQKTYNILKQLGLNPNFILNYAKNKEYDYICMIDDDIQFFGEIIPIRKRKKGNEAFLKALEYFKNSKTCGTMQYTQFAWCQKKPIIYNRGLEVVMFLYMPQLQDVYFEEDTIEDRDFSLNIILNYNIETFRLNHLYFLTPSIGTNKGGIELNRHQKQIEWSQKMEQKWGSDICKYVIKKNGIPDIKINWRTVDKIVNRKKMIIEEKLPLT